MRQIKFRGKDIETGEWLYGDLRLRAGCFPSIIQRTCCEGKIGGGKTVMLDCYN